MDSFLHASTSFLLRQRPCIICLYLVQLLYYITLIQVTQAFFINFLPCFIMDFIAKANFAPLMGHAKTSYTIQAVQEYRSGKRFPNNTSKKTGNADVERKNDIAFTACNIFYTTLFCHNINYNPKSYSLYYKAIFPDTETLPKTVAAILFLYS